MHNLFNFPSLINAGFGNFSTTDQCRIWTFFRHFSKHILRYFPHWSCLKLTPAFSALFSSCVLFRVFIFL
jgi:hypothetical protein